MNKKIGFGILSAAVLTPSLAMAEVNQPQEIIDRPRTTPAGQITAGADIISFITVDGTPTGLRLGGQYGVNEKLEVGASYALGLKEFEAKGDLVVSAAYSVLNAGNLSLAADVSLGFNVLAEGLDPIGLGAEVQFKLGPKMAIYSPGQQLSIGIADETGKAITLGLPVGFAYQASPALHVFAQTELANISIKDSATVVFGADYIPLSVGAFFSPSNAMDVGAQLIWLDLKEASGDPAIGLSGRLHL